MTHLNYPSGYTLLAQRVKGFGAHRKRWAWIYAFAWFVILGPGSLLALTILDALVPLPWYLLLPLFALSAGLTLVVAVVYAILPLLTPVDIEREAVVLESLHGQLDNQVIGSLQLGKEVVEASAAGRPLGYSIAIVNALIARTADNIGALNVTALVNRKKTYRDLSFAGGIALGFILLAVLAPRVLAQRVERIGDAYATLMDLLFPVNIVVTPGDQSLVRGTPVSLGVEIAKSRRSRIRLIRTDLKTKAAIAEEFSLDEHHRFSLDIKSAQESFTYQFEYAGRRSPLHSILVGDLPTIAAMNTELTYPSYTGMPTRTLVGRLPKIQALQGTGVLVSIASTVDLHPELSYVSWQNHPRQELVITGRFAHFFFPIDGPERATIRLTGALGKGFEMPDPHSIEIAVQRDNPPTVELLLSPAMKILIRDKKLTMLVEEAAHFGVSAIAEDDFGVAEVSLDYKIDTPDRQLQRPPRDGTLSLRVDPPQDRVKRSFPEIFKTLSPALLPGDHVVITVSAKDNNTVSAAGPGIGRAPPIEFTVVRPDLGSYVEQQFGFGTDPLLGGLKRVQRATNLLIEAERTTHTEAKATFEKHDVKSRVGAESWPGGSQDAVGDYFRLLSGEK